jgi:hypothetical protein
MYRALSLKAVPLKHSQTATIISRFRPFRDIFGGERVQLDRETKNDIRAAKKLRLPWRGVLLVILISFLCSWLFNHFGRLDLTLPTLNTIAVFGFLLVVKRKLWRQAWFWIVMTFIAAAHVELILLIPWTTKWVPAAVIAGTDSLDVIVVLTILNYSGKPSRGRENAL